VSAEGALALSRARGPAAPEESAATREERDRAARAHRIDLGRRAPPLPSTPIPITAFVVVVVPVPVPIPVSPVPVSAWIPVPASVAPSIGERGRSGKTDRHQSEQCEASGANPVFHCFFPSVPSERLLTISPRCPARQAAVVITNTGKMRSKVTSSTVSIFGNRTGRKPGSDVSTRPARSSGGSGRRPCPRGRSGRPHSRGSKGRPFRTWVGPCRTRPRGRAGTPSRGRRRRCPWGSRRPGTCTRPTAGS
jgi:hypothetical protein